MIYLLSLAWKIDYYKQFNCSKFTACTHFHMIYIIGNQTSEIVGNF